MVPNASSLIIIVIIMIIIIIIMDLNDHIYMYHYIYIKKSLPHVFKYKIDTHTHVVYPSTPVNKITRILIILFYRS